MIRIKLDIFQTKKLQQNARKHIQMSLETKMAWKKRMQNVSKKFAKSNHFLRMFSRFSDWLHRQEQRNVVLLRSWQKSYCIYMWLSWKTDNGRGREEIITPGGGGCHKARRVMTDRQVHNRDKKTKQPLADCIEYQSPAHGTLCLSALTCNTGFMKLISQIRMA